MGSEMCIRDRVFTGQFASAQDLGIDRPRTLHADVGGFVSKILPMDSGGIGLRLDISTSPRLAFEVGVEWTEVFVPPYWQPFPAAVTSTNGTFVFIDDGSLTGGFNPMRFYRIQVLP